jgi:hypothetical protein
LGHDPGSLRVVWWLSQACPTLQDTGSWAQATVRALREIRGVATLATPRPHGTIGATVCHAPVRTFPTALNIQGADQRTPAPGLGRCFLPRNGLARRAPGMMLIVWESRACAGPPLPLLCALTFVTEEDSMRRPLPMAIPVAWKSRPYAGPPLPLLYESRFLIWSGRPFRRAFHDA